MPSNARVPNIDTSDPRFIELAELLGELIEERCDDPDDFLARSDAALEVFADVMSAFEQTAHRPPSGPPRQDS